MDNIRLYQADDWPHVWRMLEPVFRAGETYAFPTDITESEAREAWVELPRAAYVYIDADNGIVGTYYIKANQPGAGSHVCNCGYVVDARAAGRGIASTMCRHSQEEALRMGFLSMQYNLVVSTNEVAVNLWKKHGFHVAGRLPRAFNHKLLGLVDALIMYKILKPEL